MNLILWRHAEAHDADSSQDDLERALTAKGERQARRVAQWLKRQLPPRTQVLASPARRCQQTAAALQGSFETVAELAPGRGAAALLQAARWPDAQEPVVVVGHQPTLGLLAAKLLGDQQAPWRVRKGAVCWLRAEMHDGVVQVVLHAAVSPDQV